MTRSTSFVVRREGDFFANELRHDGDDGGDGDAAGDSDADAHEDESAKKRLYLAYLEGLYE